MRIYWMNLKTKILTKKVLDKIISFMLTVLGICVILAVCAWFIFPYYQRFDYIKTCTDGGRSKSLCLQEWAEIDKLD